MSLTMVVLWFVPAASAWTWDDVEAPAGSSLTWHLCDAHFTDAEELVIELAAERWDAGTGKPMRGAVWDFIQGSDRDAVYCDKDNGYNEVYERLDSWFSDRGMGSAVIAVCANKVTTNDVDIVFKHSKPWSAELPTYAELGDLSRGQTALHEFGHALGFNHTDGDDPATVTGTMNSGYPFGGDISGYYRPHEDDYVGLTVNRPHASTGTNLMLGRYVFDSGEVWDNNSGARWTVCDSTVASSSDGPEEIYAIVHSTTSVSPVIEWRLSADNVCFSGTEYVIGTRTPGLASNTAYPVAPTNYNFTGVPAGDYYVCAKIDSNDLIAETTSDADNDLVSTVPLHVQDCP